MITQTQINQILTEIKSSDEVNRRAGFSRRQKIYEDGGKDFLIDSLKKEFGDSALNEMRLAPINLLKKIVNKRSSLYKSPPKREVQTGEDSDQALIDYYSEELDLNETMDKAHRYFTLHSNLILYCIPNTESKLILRVIPPYQYSAVPNQTDPSVADIFILNRFTENVTQQDELRSASGLGTVNLERGIEKPRQLVDSNDKPLLTEREYIFWSKEEHFTVYENEKEKIQSKVDGENPLGINPIINLAKDRDGKFWSMQFEDAIDITMAIMKAWTDLLTIAKHQGFSILTIVSEEEPKQITFGINKAVWLKQRPEGNEPKINYVQATSPLSEYKDLIIELLGLLLSTSDLNPKEITGSGGGASFSSGFQALIETADTLEARKRDQSPLRRAEQELWQLIKAWHNYMFDLNILTDESRSLGKFSDNFSISIQFAEVKPLETIQDRINQGKDLQVLGLMTKADLMKFVFPDMTSEHIEKKLLEINNLTETELRSILGGSDGSEI